MPDPPDLDHLADRLLAGLRGQDVAAGDAAEPAIGDEDHLCWARRPGQHLD